MCPFYEIIYMLTIDILICTIDEGILDVPKVLLPTCEGVNYIVSMQCSDESFRSVIPDILMRDDVKLSIIEGKGLSANRNNAIANSSADICVIADDDVRYDLDTLNVLRGLYLSRPDADVIILKASDVNGMPLKNYPKDTFSFPHVPKGYYPMSIEVTFRRKSVQGIWFDTRFGLGSEYTAYGEEEVWVNSLVRKGVKVVYVPLTFVETTECPKSALGLALSKKKQFTKGAVLYYIYGWTSVLRCLKCAFLISDNIATAFSSFVQMMKGICYVIKTGGRNV